VLPFFELVVLGFFFETEFKSFVGCVTIRQGTSRNVKERQGTSRNVNKRQGTSTNVKERQQTSRNQSPFIVILEVAVLGSFVHIFVGLWLFLGVLDLAYVFRIHNRF